MTVLHYTCCTISLVHITYMTFFAVSGVKMCPVFNAMQHQLLNAVNSNAMQCNAMQCNAMQHPNSFNPANCQHISIHN